MLYPVVDLDEWCKKFDLRVRKRKCFECHRILKTTVPFADKSGFGLISPICECGSTGRISVEILRNNKFETLTSMMGPFPGE